MIKDLANSGATPVLEKVLQFAAHRQKLIAHNISNMGTPDFRPMDVSTRDFQKALAKAVDKRRGETSGTHGELEFGGNSEVQAASSGRLSITPKTASGNILRHDRNNSDLERMMQDLAENTLTYRATADLIKREHDLVKMAISQRV
jgi:flagellar basal-body rod protein FlgB